MVEQSDIESAFLLDCRFSETEFEVLVEVGEVAMVAWVLDWDKARTATSAGLGAGVYLNKQC